MNDYDPVADLIHHIRELNRIWGEWCLDFHPAYPAALEAADRAERWVDDPREVEVM